MRQKMTKVLSVMLAVLVFASMLTIVSSAYTAYNSYNYNYYGEAIETPAGYTPVEVLYGTDLGIGELGTPVDIYVSPQEEIYILDYFGTENMARLHIFDSEFNFKMTISSLTYKGAPYTMNLPESVAVDVNGYIYICDTGNAKVLKLDKSKSGEVVQIVETPKTDMFEGEFKPSKVAIAKNLSLYVISNSTLDGIMEFNAKGEFLRYFGAPDVQMSVADMVSLAWRRVYRSLFGDDVDESFVTFVPTEFENLVVDDFGFVYSVIAASGESNTNQLLKMNFLGNNILDPTAQSTQKISSTLSSTYGDLIRLSTAGSGNIFVDVSVDEDGFITLLDSNLCKIFEYDSEANMVAVYGGKGKQQGLFQSPKAMAKLGKKTLVLDGYNRSVTVFELTDYGETFHNGIILYNQGLYTDAESYWDEVLKLNANCELAHIGLGKVYYQYGDYATALSHFKVSNDRMNYENAYALYREQVIADHFDLIMTVVLVIAVLMLIWRFFGKSIVEAIKEKKQGGGDHDDAEIVE